MEKSEQVDLIIYRVHDKGLEVFMVNDLDPASNEGRLKTLSSELGAAQMVNHHCIELDPVLDANGTERKAIAVEADWHELPSLRAMMYEDFRVAKEKARQKIRNFIPEFDQGGFVTVKEAIKKVMPEQYAFLKELKEILSDKNQTKYI